MTPPVPASSARPDRLAHLAADAAERATRLDRSVGEVVAALTTYRLSCPDGRPAGHPEAAALHAIVRTRRLATRVEQIARAFARADSGGSPTVATARDRALGLVLTSGPSGAGLPDALHAPERNEAGLRVGRRLAQLDADEAATAIAAWADRPSDGAFAAGVLTGLGADGIRRLVAAIEGVYGQRGWGRPRVDASFLGLSALVQRAGARLPSGAEAEPYALDLGLIQELGRTLPGRAALRQIVLGAGRLHPAVTAAFAAALLHPLPGPPDLLQASRALIDRTEQRSLVQSIDLPILLRLEGDPEAAARWEAGSPPGRSRLAEQLGRTSNRELAAMASAARVLYLTPALAHPARSWQPLVGGARRPPEGIRTELVLDALLAVVQRATHPVASVSQTLALAVAAHPAFVEHRIAERAFRSLEPDPALLRWFEVLAFDPVALDRAVATISARIRSTASACVAGTAPGTGPAEALRSCLQPVRETGLLLVRGAARAGRTHHLLVSWAIQGIAGGLNLSVDKGAGPAAPVVEIVTRAAIGDSQDAAIDALAWSDAHLDRAPARALDRSIQLLAAQAMAADGRWRPTLRDADRLGALAVVASDDDWRAFRAWVTRQEPAVRDTLITLRP